VTGVSVNPHWISRHGVSGRGVTWHSRNRYSLPIFAFTAALAFLMVSIVGPSPTASAAESYDPSLTGKGQKLLVAADAGDGVVSERDAYSVTKKIVTPSFALVPAAGTPDPGTAQAIGHEMVLARGWGEDQYSCLVLLFNKESHWNVYAANPSGAYGIPQALPGSKMASAGADWQTNPATQIAWGLGYITARYGTPCGAWAKSQSSGWY
jgi:hypothetical protein